MIDGAITRQEKEFYDRRIRIAREHKLATCGKGEITCELFGETEATNLHFKPVRERTAAELAVRDLNLRAARDRGRIKHKIAATKRAQIRAKGTYGVTIVPHTDKTRLRWRAHIDKRAFAFDCALDAAECRNRAMRKKYPDFPIFCVDIDAIWHKWGCACGNHVRPGE